LAGARNVFANRAPALNDHGIVQANFLELTTAQRSLVLAQTRRIVNKALARHAIEDLSKVIG
jgi:hypothetical protein